MPPDAAEAVIVNGSAAGVSPLTRFPAMDADTMTHRRKRAFFIWIGNTKKVRCRSESPVKIYEKSGKVTSLEGPGSFEIY